VPNDPRIEPAGPDDLDPVRDLFREYAAFLGVDLSFQGFEDELAGLPGGYAPPAGRLLVARAGGTLAGCVALRRMDGATVEMKRLYIRPAWRGHGLGRRLAEAALAEAGAAGYRRMRLDTFAALAAAIRLYRTLGFEEIPPYNASPLPGMRYFEKAL